MKIPKKGKYFLILISLFLLQACGGTNPENAIGSNNDAESPAHNLEVATDNHAAENSVDSNSSAEGAPNDTISDLPTVAPQEVVEVLPPIPVVSYGTRNQWFNPTPPSEIQVANGGLQFIKFSAVW